MMLTVGAAERQNFRTCGKRLGCPTGQTDRSSRTAHCRFSLPVTQELPGDLYDHKTILGWGSLTYWPEAGMMPERWNSGPCGNTCTDLQVIMRNQYSDD